jgi:outer membrane protein assembly factor BamB
MKSLKWIVLVNIFLVLSGCSVFGKKTGNEPVKLVKFEATAKINRVWSTNVGAGQGPGFTRLSPVMEGDRIYTVDHKGEVVALARSNGKKIWNRKLHDAVSAGITLEHGLLLIATTAGELVALTPADGQELWRTQLEGEVLAAPRTNGQVVAAQTINGRIYVVDAKTGKDLWFYENPPPVLTLRGTPSPVVTDNAIYAGFSNGRFMAFNPDNGSILWEQRIAIPQGRSELSRMVDIHATPILHEGMLYVSTYQGKVAALARGTGSGIWSQDSSSSESMALFGNRLYLTQSDSTVIAYNATTGEILWENDQMLRRGLNGPQIIGDYLAVVDYKGYMHVLNRDSGELAARTRVNRKGARGAMLTDGEILYVYGNNGKLVAFRAAEK